MARLSLTVFIVVSFVAVLGIAVLLQTQGTAYAIAGQPRSCVGVANEYDDVIRNTLSMASTGNPGYHSELIMMYNPCRNSNETGFSESIIERRPLMSYYRFEGEVTGDVYGYIGGPEPDWGNIQYWMCDLDNNDIYDSGRLVISGRDVYCGNRI